MYFTGKLDQIRIYYTTLCAQLESLRLQAGGRAVHILGLKRTVWSIQVHHGNNGSVLFQLKYDGQRFPFKAHNGTQCKAFCNFCQLRGYPSNLNKDGNIEVRTLPPNYFFFLNSNIGYVGLKLDATPPYQELFS